MNYNFRVWEIFAKLRFNFIRSRRRSRPDAAGLRIPMEFTQRMRFFSERICMIWVLLVGSPPQSCAKQIIDFPSIIFYLAYRETLRTTSTKFFAPRRQDRKEIFFPTSPNLAPFAPLRESSCIKSIPGFYKTLDPSTREPRLARERSAPQRSRPTANFSLTPRPEIRKHLSP